MPSQKVLVVDDDLLLACLVGDALVEAGFDVVVASTQEDAIDQIARLDGQLVALVTDIRIGAGSGWTVATHARDSNAALPVIYMTGDSARSWQTLGVPDAFWSRSPSNRPKSLLPSFA